MTGLERQGRALTPTIDEARKIGKRLKARGVVVLAFHDDGTIGGASYGRTRKDCKELGQYLDGTINDMIEGRWPAPWVPR